MHKLEKGKWLEGDHISAAGKVLRQQFKDKINSLQDPGKAENPSLFVPQSSDPTIQIHHNGADHWLTSTCKKGVVQLYNSKWHDDITPSVHLQLGALYGVRAKRGSLRVDICHVARQEGSNDCGLFAIA